jgi:hypothetical protein
MKSFDVRATCSATMNDAVPSPSHPSQERAWGEEVVAVFCRRCEELPLARGGTMNHIEKLRRSAMSIAADGLALHQAP